VLEKIFHLDPNLLLAVLQWRWHPVAEHGILKGVSEIQTLWEGCMKLLHLRIYITQENYAAVT
jgi:hypothetical protein